MIDYIGFCKNKSEILQAKNLAFENFRNVKALQNIFWNDVDNLKPDSIYIIKQKDMVLGLIRVVERIVLRGKDKLKICGLSHICIKKNYRKKGLLNILMTGCIETLKERGFDFIYLIARKKVDKMYSKYGFIGISSYEKKILNLDDENTNVNKLKITKIGQNDINFIQRCYLKNYKKNLFFFHRSTSRWKYLIKFLNLYKINIQLIKSDNIRIGYIIFKDNHVYEYGLTEGKYFKLTKLLFNKLFKKNVIIDIGDDHRLNENINDLEFSSYRKRVDFGGHMVKILNYDKLINSAKKDLFLIFKNNNIKSFAYTNPSYSIKLKKNNLEIRFSKNYKSEVKSNLFLLHVKVLGESHVGKINFGKFFSFLKADEI